MASTLPSIVNFQGVGSSSHVTRYSDGSFLTVWTSFDAQRNAYVHGKIFNANGTVKKDTFLIDSDTDVSYTDVTAIALSDGRTAIAWTTNDGGGKIIGKVLDGAYTPSTGLLEIGDTTKAIGQGHPKASALQNGGFAIVYEGASTDTQPATPSYFGAVFMYEQAGWVRKSNQPIQAIYDAARDAEKGAILQNGAYASTFASGSEEVNLFVLIYDPNVGGAPTYFPIDSFPSGVDAIHSTITPISGSRFIVCWQDGDVIRAQVVTSAGTLAGNPVTIVLPAGKLVEAPVLSELDNGGFAIAFRVDVGNGDDNVYTAAFAADGSGIAGLTYVGTSTRGDQWNPSITALKGNSYAVTWLSDTDTGSGFFVEVIGAAGGTEQPPPPPPSTTWIGTNGNDSRTGTDLSEIFKGLGGRDTLDGGAGDDTIWGGAGNDSLKGNAGRDIFVFDSKPNKSSNKDKIVDFNVKDDTIWLDNKIFKKLGTKGSETKPAQLKKDFFAIGSKAKDKDDYIVYDRAKGVLYYDSDGSGKGKAVEIATLSKKLAMTYKDFFVI